MNALLLALLLAETPFPSSIRARQGTSLDGGSWGWAVECVNCTAGGSSSGLVYIVDAGAPLNINPPATLPLPAGAATGAKQDTGNTSISSIDGKTATLVSGRVPVDPSGVTSPVSAASLPLPSGASTGARQDTGNTSLSSIDTKTPALVGGRQPVDGSGVTQPVSGTFWQATQPVSAASLPLPSGAATDSTLSQLLDGGVLQLGRSSDGAARAIAVTDQGVQWVQQLPSPLQRPNTLGLACNAVRRTNCR